MWHAHGRGEVRTRFWFGNLRKRDHLENLGLDQRIIFKLILNVIGGVDSIDVAQVWGRLQTLVSTVMNFWVT
jgi:hypothetical protein